MKLYVFNPDADMALGNNEENYMAPASIRRMAEDLALLPIWYAQPGDAVLAPSAYNAAYLKQLQQLFSLEVQLVTEPELPDYADVQIMPWAWNRAMRKRMLKGGVTEEALPTFEQLDNYRRLASRAYPLALQSLWNKQEMAYVCGLSRLVKGEDQSPVSAEIIADFKEGAVFKSPWSGSGKGLFWCRYGFKKEASDWCNRLLREYGFFMVEPIYNKVEDFAVEYYSDGRGKVSFAGYSRFVTNEKGAYNHNILTSEKQTEEWLQQYVPLEAFMRIRKRLEEGLHTLYAHSYTGYFGVDMMVCRQEGEPAYAIHPHVEVNLRMNMGVVAHLLCENRIVPGAEGCFFVDHFSSNEALRARHEYYSNCYPLAIKDGKVVSGYLSLVPVTPKSLSQAYILVR